MMFKTLRPLAFVLVLMTLGACSGSIRYALLGSRDHTTTEGEARFDERDGGGYDLEVTLDRLPLASQFDLPTAHYVVWTREGNEATTRFGELEIQPGTRTGRAKGVVRSRSLELIVTVEGIADITEPSGAEIVHSILEIAR